MNTALRLGRRYTLHAMAAGLKLETAVHAVTADFGDHLFKTAVLAFVGAHDLHAPATRFGVTAVHAEQVSGEQCRLITARSGADFHKRVTLVV